MPSERSFRRHACLLRPPKKVPADLRNIFAVRKNFPQACMPSKTSAKSSCSHQHLFRNAKVFCSVAPKREHNFVSRNLKTSLALDNVRDVIHTRLIDGVDIHLNGAARCFQRFGLFRSKSDVLKYSAHPRLKISPVCRQCFVYKSRHVRSALRERLGPGPCRSRRELRTARSSCTPSSH